MHRNVEKSKIAGYAIEIGPALEGRGALAELDPILAPS
jgi:hypothetical protein